jgi:hypothetical protein
MGKDPTRAAERINAYNIGMENLFSSKWLGFYDVSICDDFGITFLLL